MRTVLPDSEAVVRAWDQPTAAKATGKVQRVVQAAVCFKYDAFGEFLVASSWCGYWMERAWEWGQARRIMVYRKVQDEYK